MGNSSAFGPYVEEEVKCKLCNASFELGNLWDEGLCNECDSLKSFMINWLVNSGQTTWDEYYDFSSPRDLFLVK